MWGRGPATEVPVSGRDYDVFWEEPVASVQVFLTDACMCVHMPVHAHTDTHTQTHTCTRTHTLSAASLPCISVYTVNPEILFPFL